MASSVSNQRGRSRPSSPRTGAGLVSAGPAPAPRATSSIGAALVAALAAALVGGLTTTAAGQSGEPDAGPVIDEETLRAPRACTSETIFSRPDYPDPTESRLASGAPGPAYWQQRADYAIEAELDAEARRVTGRAVITYHNNSPHALDYLWLHLEQNMFRRDSLRHTSVSPGLLADLPEGFEGGIEITSLRAGVDDLPLAVYDTLGRIDLPRPLPPRSTFSFSVAWTFEIPPDGDQRLGIDAVAGGPIFQIAQWFPAVAVYDDAHGWNTLPFTGLGEFYTDFGDYEVSITVPREHLVAATGELRNPDDVLTGEQRSRLNGARRSARTTMIRTEEEAASGSGRPPGAGPLTWRYTAKNCRTFAWASSPAFIWDAAWSASGGPGNAGVLAQSMYPAEALPLWSSATDMLRFSIEHYSDRWYPYPYPVATNVNGMVGGMEYPMLIYCSERADDRGLFGVTTHEIGHNWFPMLVSTDERRHGWMDEGVNTFINYYAEIARYGTPDPGYWDFESWTGLFEHVAPPVESPPDRMPDDLWGWLVYDKPAWALIMLREQVLGPERFDAAFRTYIRRWAFKSPRPADFFRTMEDAAGADLSWFWRSFFLEDCALDQGIGGVYQEGAGPATVVVSNYGDAVMPVTLWLKYADGTEDRRSLPADIWAVADEWAARFDTSGREVVRAIVDPDWALPDLDRSDNVWEK